MVKSISNIMIAVLCSLGLLAIVSCQGDVYYADYHDIPGKKWDHRDTLSFDIPAPENDADVRLTVAVRHTQEYKYEGLTLRAIMCDSTSRHAWDVQIKTSPDGKDSKRGMVYVESSSSPMMLHLHKGEQMTLRLTHRMRLNPIEGISNVEVMLENIKQTIR